jgi:hypothetical protein
VIHRSAFGLSDNMRDRTTGCLDPDQCRAGQGRRRIAEQLTDYCNEQSIPVPDITAVYELSPDMALADGNFLALVDSDSYYRTRPLDEHEAKGGTDTGAATASPDTGAVGVPTCA